MTAGNERTSLKSLLPISPNSIQSRCNENINGLEENSDEEMDIEINEGEGVR